MAYCNFKASRHEQQQRPAPAFAPDTQPQGDHSGPDTTQNPSCLPYSASKLDAYNGVLYDMKYFLMVCVCIAIDTGIKVHIKSKQESNRWMEVSSMLLCLSDFYAMICVAVVVPVYWYFTHPSVMSYIRSSFSRDSVIVI